MKANEYIKKYSVDCAKEILKHNQDLMNIGFFIDLKHLVESHELVESYGGLESSKLTVNYPNFLNDEDIKTTNYRLSKAIADVESCMEVSSESN